MAKHLSLGRKVRNANLNNSRQKFQSVNTAIIHSHKEKHYLRQIFDSTEPIN